MRVKTRSPAGRIKLHWKREMTSHARCANCKSVLLGVPRRTSSGIRKLSASDKGPQRPYGGYLCSNCSREIFREKIRGV